MSAAKKAIFQATVYSDGTSTVIDANSAVVINASSGEPHFNGEPLSALSEIAQEILRQSAHPTNTAVDHNTDAGTPSPEVSYNEGGETKITLPRTYVNGCKGNSDFDVGSVAAGVNKTISLTAAGAGDCHGEFQAVDRSGAPLTAVQQGSDPTLTFTGTGLDVVIHVRLDTPLKRMVVVAQN